MTVSRRTSAGHASSSCGSWNAPGPCVVRHFGRTRKDRWTLGAEDFFVTPALGVTGRDHPQVLFLVASRFFGPRSIPHRIEWVRFIASSLCTWPGWWVTFHGLRDVPWVYVPYVSRRSITRTCRRSAAGWFRLLFPAFQTDFKHGVGLMQNQSGT